MNGVRNRYFERFLRPFFCPDKFFPARCGFDVGDLARTWANMLAGQFLGDKDAQAGRGDGVASATSRLTLSTSSCEEATSSRFQIAQLEPSVQRATKASLNLWLRTGGGRQDNPLV